MKDDRIKSVSDKEAPTILHECRELMTCHLKQTLPDMMDAVDDVLLDIAIKTTNSLERKKYFNAMHEVRLKRDDIERQCIENFVELFNEDLGSDNHARNESEGSKDMGSMSMTATINKIRNNCHQALLNLDKRMNMVQKSDANNIRRNPFSPEVICQALYNASEQLGPGAEIRLIMFKCFEKCVTFSLNDVYLEIDNVLESGRSGIKPGLKKQQSSTVDNSSRSYTNIALTRQTVTSEMNNLLRDKHTPEFVSDFILKYWVILLIRIYDRSGKHSDAWRHAIDTVNDLVWSVGSISSKEDRDRFDKLWPDLIKRLRNGINMMSMSANEETDFISRLSKHRATLTRIGALSKFKNKDVTLVKPEKISALKMKIKSAFVQPVAKEMGLDSTGSGDTTLPTIKKLSSERPFMDELLVDNHDTEVDLNNTGSENTTMPGLKKLANKRLFMDELLVDNKNIEGLKRDTDES